MNQAITNYTFDASAKTITFGDFVTIALERVNGVKNLTTGAWVYKATDLAFGGSVATNVLTFTASNSGMNDTDDLLIRYDAPESLDVQLVDGVFWQATQPISDAGGSLTVDDGGSTLSIDDGGGSLTVDGAVSLTGSVPAGTNNIGDVDVLSLPSIPAGTNNIGDVDVASLPAIPTGSNVIGALVADQTVNVSKINGVTPLMGAGNTGTGSPRVTIATDQADIAIKEIPQTSGGLSTYHLASAGSTNATVIKASAGQVYGWYIYNSNAAARKVVFHNTASTPTAGASVFFSLVIPPTSGANVFSSIGIPFSSGVAITAVTGLADNDSAAVAANDLIINIFYK